MQIIVSTPLATETGAKVLFIVGVCIHVLATNTGRRRPQCRVRLEPEATGIVRVCARGIVRV